MGTMIVVDPRQKAGQTRLDFHLTAMDSANHYGENPPGAPRLLSTPRAALEEAASWATFAVEDEAGADLGPRETKAEIVGGIAT